VSNKDAILNVDHAIVDVELFDGGAPSGRVTFPEDLLKVSIKKFCRRSVIGSPRIRVAVSRSTVRFVRAVRITR
jgi:hypothetical protein